MKSENRIYIKGKIGNDARVNKVGERSVANFSVATDFDFRAKDGKWNKETTWHNVCAWQGYGICDLSLLRKGEAVVVTGRLRRREYTDNQGNKRDLMEIVAESVDIIEQEQTQQSQAQGQQNYPAPVDDIPF